MLDAKLVGMASLRGNTTPFPLCHLWRGHLHKKLVRFLTAGGANDIPPYSLSWYAYIFELAKINANVGSQRLSCQSCLFFRAVSPY